MFETEQEARERATELADRNWIVRRGGTHSQAIAQIIYETYMVAWRESR